MGGRGTFSSTNVDFPADTLLGAPTDLILNPSGALGRLVIMKDPGPVGDLGLDISASVSASSASASSVVGELDSEEATSSDATDPAAVDGFIPAPGSCSATSGAKDGLLLWLELVDKVRLRGSATLRESATLRGSATMWGLATLELADEGTVELVDVARGRGTVNGLI